LSKENPNIRDGSDIERYYQKIFESQWDSEMGHHGYVLIDGGQVVGFLGAYFSRRNIAGELKRFCNLTTWKVDLNYRNESLKLLFPFMRLGTHTITVFSAGGNVYPIYLKLGFLSLETTLKIIPAVPSSATMSRGVKCLFSKDEILRYLDADDTAILEDHWQFDCCHALFSSGRSYTYLVYTRSQKKGIPVIYIHHITNVDLFIKIIDRIKFEFLIRCKISVMVTESRFLGDRQMRFIKNYRLKVPRIFRSTQLSPGKIDNLYSELVVSDLFREGFY
jgi:hypothetical protein